MRQCCFCVVCALPMYNTSAHTYVGLVSRPSGWSEKMRVARIFFLMPCSLVNRAMLFLCSLRIANVYYKCTHVRGTCVTTQWVVGEIPRRADLYFFLLPSSLGNGAMLFSCCLRIANVQYKCTHVRWTCVTTQWMVGENPRRADFYFFLLPSSLGNRARLFCVVCALPMNNTSAQTCVGLETRPSGWSEKCRVARIFIFSFCQAPWAMGQCCFRVVCALPMYNTSAHTYVGLVSRPSEWSEKIRVARIFIFSFCQAPWAMGQCCFCVVCALPMYNTSAQTCVGLETRPSGWSEKSRVARIFIFSFCQAPWAMGQCCFRVVCALPMYNTSAHTYVGLVSRPSGWSEKIRVARIFIFSFCQAPWAIGQGCFCVVCALPMNNTSAQTCVGLETRPSGWSEKCRVARIFIFSFCQAPWAMGQCCFCVVCALPMYNTSAHTYVGLVSRPSEWSEKIRVARIFIFSFRQAPWAMGQCCFCVVCALPMYNTSAQTCVGLETRPSGWSEKIRVARIFVFSFCQAPWSMVQCCFCVVCALPMYNTSAHTYVGLLSRPSGWPEKIRVARIFLFPFAKLPGQWGNVVFVLFAHCQCTIQVHTRT